ncbi:MAG: VanZ family protein [Nitrospirae bacterium]|nr:VanZ family protein [Nitrospirota bacterium]
MKTKKKFSIWIPPFIWMALIYLFSTSGFSEEDTATFLLPILNALFPEASQSTLSKIHSFIRKSGHFIEFAILSLLWVRTLRKVWEERHYPFYLVSFFLSVIYAIVDEFHQSFVSERTASLLDIFIDSAGAASSLFFLKIYVISRNWKGIRRKGLKD